MDEERYHKELLSRLDKILEYLSLSCSLPEACLVEPQDQPTTQPESPGQTVTASNGRQYLLDDEMQDVHEMAMQRWKAARAAKGQEGS